MNGSNRGLEWRFTVHGRGRMLFELDYFPDVGEASWRRTQVLESDCCVQNLSPTCMCCVSWPSYSLSLGLWVFISTTRIRIKSVPEPPCTCPQEPTQLLPALRLAIEHCQLDIGHGGRVYHGNWQRLQSYKTGLFKFFFLFIYLYINIDAWLVVKHLPALRISFHSC